MKTKEVPAGKSGIFPAIRNHWEKNSAHQRNLPRRIKKKRKFNKPPPQTSKNRKDNSKILAKQASILIGKLGAPNERTRIAKKIKKIRLIIFNLKNHQKLEEAITLKRKLTEKLKEIKPQIPQKLNLSAEEIKEAEHRIKGLLKEFPEKSLIQILPILVKEENWNAVRVAIARIERNQSKKLTPEDRIYLKEIKEELQKEAT